VPSVGGLALPPSTTKPMPNVNTKGKARAKVALAPGHGALDWASLKSSGVDLRVSHKPKHASICLTP
jgi:N-acetylmuramoyl-L-alanine amidase